MGTGVSPPPWSPNRVIVLPGSAAPRAEALDLASFRRRNVVRSTAHFAHEPLLLHLASEVTERLLELRWILYDDTHNPTRIPIARTDCSGTLLSAAGAISKTSPLRPLCAKTGHATFGCRLQALVEIVGQGESLLLRQLAHSGRSDSVGEVASHSFSNRAHGEGR